MTLISKTAGGLSVLSCIYDIHKTALIYSNNAYAKASSDTFIASDIGAQKIDKVSYKDAQRKNWLLKNNFLSGIKEAAARVGGYFSGVAQGVVRYLPKFVLSAFAIIPKNKHVANISTIALAGVETYDFVKNSTNLLQRTDYLE